MTDKVIIGTGTMYDQTVWAVVRPDGTACWLVPKPSDWCGYAERKATEHFGAVAWEEMKVGGYYLESYRLIRKETEKDNEDGNKT